MKMKYVERFQNIASYYISPSCTPHQFTPASQIPQSDPSSINPALLMPRKCSDSADNFCYICVAVTFTRQRKTISSVVTKAYHLYFGCNIGDQDKSWATHIYCRNCATHLSQWLNGKRHAFPNLRKNLSSIQTTRTKGSRTRVLLSPRRLLNTRLPRYVFCATATHSHTGRTERSCSRSGAVQEQSRVTGIET
jgi:hypothetical protein